MERRTHPTAGLKHQQSDRRLPRAGVLPTLADTFSPLDAPPSDLTDSDINPTGGVIGFTNVYTFASNVISTTTIDAGIETSRLFSNGFE